jgi:hypothetical protein
VALAGEHLHERLHHHLFLVRHHVHPSILLGLLSQS